jgi:hypothetical protein
VSTSAITAGTVTRIRELAAELDTLGKTALEKAIEAGNLLRQCKEGLAHGTWLPWLEENFSFTDRTARRWMKISEDAETGKLKTDTVSNLSEAYRITAEPKQIVADSDAQKVPYKMPSVNQRMLLISPSGVYAAIEPMGETYVQVTFTEKQLNPLGGCDEIRFGSICGTKRGIHKDHAWFFLTENTHADWKTAKVGYVPWTPPDISKSTLNPNLYGDNISWLDECFELELEAA